MLYKNKKKYLNNIKVIEGSVGTQHCFYNTDIEEVAEAMFEYNIFII